VRGLPPPRRPLCVAFRVCLEGAAAGEAGTRAFLSRTHTHPSTFWRGINSLRANSRRRRRLPRRVIDCRKRPPLCIDVFRSARIYVLSMRENSLRQLAQRPPPAWLSSITVGRPRRRAWLMVTSSLSAVFRPFGLAMQSAHRNFPESSSISNEGARACVYTHKQAN